MRTNVVTTTLPDSISGDAIDGGAISSLASLEIVDAFSVVKLFLTGAAGSFIKNTQIGSVTLAECDQVWSTQIRAFNGMSLISVIDLSTLFEVYESGSKTVRGNYYDNGDNFFKISKPLMEMTPTVLHLMTTTAPPFGYSTRTGANWYFEGTISAGSLVVRGGSTIPTGTLGGLNIVSMAANHSAMWAWYNGWAVSTARTKISTISLIAATSVFDIGATAISAAAWPFVATMDQNVDTTGTPLFTSVRTLQGGQAFDYSLSAFGYNAISYARTTADLFNAPFTMWMDVSLARWGSLGRITIHEFSWATDNTVTGNAWMVTLGVSATVDGGDFFDGVVDAGFTDGVGANKLKDSSASFLSTVTIGDIVTNVTATPDTYATVTAIDSDIQLAIDADIFVSLQSYRVVHGSFIELGISRCTVDGTSAVLRVSYQYLGGPKLLFELLKHDGTDYDVTGGAPATIATDRHITFGIPYVLDGYTP